MNEPLTHHGIKGMKWGIRRTEEQLSGTKTRMDAASSISREAGNINSSVSKMRSASKEKNLRSMSDQELREKVNRLNLEQQYSKLTSNQTSKGQAYMKNILDIAGSTFAIAGSAAAIALSIKQLKGS